MARLAKIEPEDWDPRLQAALKPQDRTPLEQGLMRYFAHTPDLALGVGALGGALKRHRTLPDRLVELVRLRVAFHNQCRSCMAIRYDVAVQDGVDEALVCQLEQPEAAPDLTPAERAALRFADLFATNHLAISDAEIEKLRAHFSEAEIVELGLNVSIFVGLGRFSAICDMTDELPERFRDRSEAVVPWGPDAILVERLDGEPAAV